MGQKKIKRSKIEGVFVDPNLEEVEEDRAFEIEVDDETHEILLVHHYRRKWGDDFDSDVEHGLTLEEAKDVASILLRWIDMETARLVIEAGLVPKSTPIPIEGNPMQGERIADKQKKEDGE